MQQWLFFTACSLRKLTVSLFAPIFRPDIPKSPGAVRAATEALKVAEAQLAQTEWLAGGDGPSLADISAYQEIGQCQDKFVDVFDFGPFPHVRAWMARCEAQPQWGETHEQPMELGRKLKQRITAKL